MITRSFLFPSTSLHLFRQNCFPSLASLTIRYKSRLKRPFYSCVISCLAFEWNWSWCWPCFDKNFAAFLTLIPANQHENSIINVRKAVNFLLTPASLSFKGQATKQTTVNWTIDWMHKWQPKKYCFAYVLISLTSLVCMDKRQNKCCLRARLVSLINTSTKEYFFWPPFMHLINYMETTATDEPSILRRSLCLYRAQS